eukprot:3344300-Pyramimonas_sp.AAC.1
MLAEGLGVHLGFSSHRPTFQNEVLVVPGALIFLEHLDHYGVICQQSSSLPGQLALGARRETETAHVERNRLDARKRRKPDHSGVLP